MRKDAEKLLKYIVDKSKRYNDTAVGINISEIEDIPNIRVAKDKLLNELEEVGVISEYKENIFGEIDVYLTTEGQEYFDKNKKDDLGSNNVITVNMSGGQFSLANDNATIYATQNNSVNVSELDKIVNGILENLADLKKEDAESIKDIVDMAKEELTKPEPKVSRLRSCVTLLAPMFTIVNGIPTLVNNLQRLMNYITPYIQ